MKQIVIEAPDPNLSFKNGAIFLGGGISDCPDWQSYFISKLNDKVNDYVIYNPRRSDFNISDKEQSKIQIKWEHEHLEDASIIVFWFPRQTLCPITLFELGKYCRDMDKTLIIGCHPYYKRRLDVIEQMKLVRPDVIVHDGIDDMVNELHYALTY